MMWKSQKRNTRQQWRQDNERKRRLRADDGRRDELVRIYGEVGMMKHNITLKSGESVAVYSERGAGPDGHFEISFDGEKLRLKTWYGEHTLQEVYRILSFETRLGEIERQLKDHIKMGEYCPHTGK